MSCRPGDSKREEFRKYLEKAGVLEALTKVLVSLYEQPERPEDALEYVKENLKITPESVAIKKDMEELKERMEELALENSKLKSELTKYDKQSDGPLPNDNPN